MSGAFRVTPESVSALGGQVTGAIEQLNGSLGTLKSEVNQVSETWGGSAAGNFQSLMVEWQSSQNQLIETLNTIAQKLQSAAVAYSDTESSVGKGFV